MNNHHPIFPIYWKKIVYPQKLFFSKKKKIQVYIQYSIFWRFTVGYWWGKNIGICFAFSLFMWIFFWQFCLIYQIIEGGNAWWLVCRIEYRPSGKINAWMDFIWYMDHYYMRMFLIFHEDIKKGVLKSNKPSLRVIY